MKKEYLGVTISQLNSLANKIKDKFSIEIEGYSGKKEYMGACLEYNYDKGKKVFYVDLSVSFPANMQYSEKDILNQLEEELIKCGWGKS
mgnify:CR=1 FL=1|tara:strand:+ start:111 stop:377 length:267 start_codon:yes stop_codon:yes gene_type:complete